MTTGVPVLHPEPERSTASRSSRRRSRRSACVAAADPAPAGRAPARHSAPERNLDMNTTRPPPDPARADRARRLLQRARRARRLERHGHGPRPRQRAHARRHARVPRARPSHARRSRCAPTCASSGRTTSPGRGSRSSASRAARPDTRRPSRGCSEPGRHRQRDQAVLRHAAGNELTAQLREHILIAADVIAAAKAGDQAKLADAQARWAANADDIAALLASANPRNWKLATLRPRCTCT